MKMSSLSRISKILKRALLAGETVEPRILFVDLDAAVRLFTHGVAADRGESLYTVKSLLINTIRCPVVRNVVGVLSRTVRHYSVPLNSGWMMNSNGSTLNFDLEDESLLGRPAEMGNSFFWQRKIRTIHNLLDVNKDGIISHDDFKLFADRFIRLGNLPHEHQVEFYELIERTWVDFKNPYNLITQEQYLEDMKHVLNDPERRKRVHQILPYLFAAVDKNRDGVISFPEYQLFFGCLNLSYTDAAKSFNVIDFDGDGQLSIEEFVKLGRRYFISEDEDDPSKFFWGPLLVP